jgi:propanediol dehydratase small subunit
LRATAGAPGCGKTYFLDELAAMRPEMVKTHCPKSLRPWFDRANVLAVNITFNGDTPFDAATETLETEKRGAALLIASRILYR